MFDCLSVEGHQDSNAMNRNPLKGQQALFVGWNPGRTGTIQGKFQW
jgi:hypothetical protein